MAQENRAGRRGGRMMNNDVELRNAVRAELAL